MEGAFFATMPAPSLRHLFFGVAALFTAVCGTYLLASENAQEPQLKVSFGRDIRPILAGNCYVCHGPDPSTRKEELRLDLREEATADRGGWAPLVPGDPEASEIWLKVSSDDPDERMPPADSGKDPLNPRQLELIRAWIEQGAEYEPHWAFIPPLRPPDPPVSDQNWSRNQVDKFILSGLENQGLSPNPEAPGGVLLRRLFLDLTGLPPGPEEYDSFLADTRADAYERVVDRLLTEEPYVSRYAERMATPWLDASRYADTNGIHMDAGRQIWKWRDWVLAAYRDNMPLDQFINEQLAGDLFPNATVSQQVASGFLRNHVITDEGGAIDEEYLMEYAVDRTNTTGSVFLGLTLGCARCHQHKFDPVSQTEYFELYSYFNSNQEPGLYTQLSDPNRAFEPFIKVPDKDQEKQLGALETELELIRGQLATSSPQDQRAVAEFLTAAAEEYGLNWAKSETVSAESQAADEIPSSTLEILEDGSVLASGENPAREDHIITLQTKESGLRMLMLEALTDTSLPHERVGRPANGNAVLSAIEVEVVSLADSTKRQNLNFIWAWADHEQKNEDYEVVNAIDPDTARGWAVDAHNVAGGRTALFMSEKEFGYPGGSEIQVRLRYQSIYDQHTLGRVRLSAGSISTRGLAALPVADSRWYGTWPYQTESRYSGYDKIFGPEADATIDFSKQYQPDNYTWVLVPGVEDGKVFNGLPAGEIVSFTGKRLFVPSARQLNISLGSDDGIQLHLNGEMVFEQRVDRGAAPDQDQLTLNLRAGINTIVAKIVNTGGVGGFYWKQLPPQDELGDALVWALVPAQTRERGVSDLPVKVSNSWRLLHSPNYRAGQDRVVALEASLKELDSQIPRTMVMSELAEPRPTFVLMRGQYDQPDNERPVKRGIPAALGSLPPDAPADRRGLAMWLTARDNPLVARVMVNRFWELVFGTGIVATTDNFGLQGEWPSHPELLDWLAVEFQENGWNVKELMRMLVTSSTYRQSSRMRPEYRELDPGTRLLSAYPRRRLGAEEIRDQALQLSGLLVEVFGGPSVKTYQPEGLWREVAMPQSNTRNFERDNGDALWRRSLYTYWKRAVPPPSLLTFDAPTREYCALRRSTTNTPLQALVLWNDVQFVEAARVLAQKSFGAAEMFRHCVGRSASAFEQGKLEDALKGFQNSFSENPESATLLLEFGDAPLPAEYDAVQLAAHTMLANAILSLDEVINKH